MGLIRITSSRVRLDVVFRAQVPETKGKTLEEIEQYFKTGKGGGGGGGNKLVIVTSVIVAIISGVLIGLLAK